MDGRFPNKFTLLFKSFLHFWTSQAVKTMMSVGPAPTIAGRILDKSGCEDNALLCPVGLMGAKCKQEDYQSKLARGMHNFHHGGGNRVNAYGGINNGNRKFTPRRHVGVGNFSSYAKSFEHTSYDDYGGYGRVNTRYDNYEHSPYDCYEKNIQRGTLLYHEWKEY
ncbi:hypothetical protein M9H77_12613 [Catharanthus roseus]|uniref:Uncharacterized protein n=1 Tax=Catharanthus roseus TaxID=4058 RepID=A0ACC0BI32_CATRO|nr:hypothetical protein M9H77_12613 [Catharanthus roseus]